jgi:transposase-like protein
VASGFLRSTVADCLPRKGRPAPGGLASLQRRPRAVRLLRSSGKTVAELSRELGVSEPTLRRWRLQAGDDRGEAAGEVRRRFPLNYQGEDRPVRILARLTADVIEAAVAVVTLPAKWAANGLGRYADQKDEPPGKAAEGQNGEGPLAAQ